jgi:hypothetical protein
VGEAKVDGRTLAPAAAVHAGFRKAVWKFVAAMAIMSGGLLLLVGAALQAISPGTSSGVVPGGPPAGKAYANAFTQAVVYGAWVDWDAQAVAAARLLGEDLLAGVPETNKAARALLEDQLAYMDWLLDCHDAMAEAMARIEAGAFGDDQDQTLVDLGACQAAMLALVIDLQKNALAYPGYHYGAVPGYGSWDQAAFQLMRKLDFDSAPALEAVSAYSSFFHGPVAPGYNSLGQVEAFLATKKLASPLGFAFSEGVALTAPSLDQGSAVAFWLRHAGALGVTPLALEMGAAGDDAFYCGVAGDQRYCPGASGPVLLTVAAAEAPFNGHGLTVFSGGNPEDDEDWGLLVRNGGAAASGDLSVVVRCADGSEWRWDVASVPAQGASFTSHAFGEDASCPAVLELRDAEDALLFSRMGEVAGEFGFAS